jgi:GntR family transcriptional regulator
MSKLNQKDIVPLYKQLKDILKANILDGKIKPCEKIPSEIELSKKYQVSRVTVRRALSELVDEGFLVTKQGKGTFASKTKLERDIVEGMSFTLSCTINGVTPGSKLITKRIMEPSERDIEELQLKAGEKVFFIERILYANGEPVILEYNYFSEKYSLMNEDIENHSLYDVLMKKYHVKFKHFKKSFEISTVNQKEALLLNIPKNSPILLVRELVIDNNKLPIHRTKQLVVGDKFKFFVYN